VIAILQAMASVAAKDAFGALSTIAMARGRALTSGLLDIGYEATFILTAAFGAGPVIKNGLTPHSITIMVVILATAFVTSTVSIRYGNKLKRANQLVGTADQLAVLTDRIAALERRPHEAVIHSSLHRFDACAGMGRALGGFGRARAERGWHGPLLSPSRSEPCCGESWCFPTLAR
jgi:hypothetical protein